MSRLRMAGRAGAGRTRWPQGAFPGTVTQLERGRSSIVGTGGG